MIEFRDYGLLEGLKEYKCFREVTDLVRVYLTPKGERNGFNFCVVEVVSYADEVWGVESELDFLIQDSQAMFDGVRHLYVGGDEGYLYYPSLSTMVKVFEVLEGLVEEYCQEE